MAVMALERVPSDIRADGGVARMSDPALIEAIQQAVTIPVMAKARIGHFAEAQVLEALGVDYIDESEVLTPGRRGPPHRQVGVPRPLRVRRHQPRRGPAPHLRGGGADPLEGRGRHRQHRRGRPPPAFDPGRHPQARPRPIRPSATPGPRTWRPRSTSCTRWPTTGRLPVPLFCAGGIATPADASLVMQLGAEAVFVGLGHLQERGPGPPGPGHRGGHHPLSTTRRSWPRSSRGLGASMPGLEIARLGAAPGRARLVAAACSTRAAAEVPPGERRRPRPAGRRRRARAALADLGVDSRPVRRPDDSPGWTASSCPAASRPRCRCCSPRRGCSSPLGKELAAGLPVFGTCAGMILLGHDGARRARRPALLRGHRHHRPPQRLRPPAGVLRVRPRRARHRRRPVARRVHPGPVVECDRCRRWRSWPLIEAVGRRV